MFTGSNNSSSFFPQDPQPNSSGCFVDSEFRYDMFTICYSILFSLGSGLNLYALYIFIRHSINRKVNELGILMMNLTVADLLFLTVLPMWAVYYHQHGNWIMPSFLCNLSGYLFFVSKYCSVVFLGAITYQQFQAITKPITTIQLSTRNRGFYIALAVWCCIPGPALYYIIGSGPIQENVNDQVFLRCFERHDTEGNTDAILAIRIVVDVCFYVIFLLVLGCSLLIIKALRGKAQVVNSESERLRTMRFVCIILTVFIICFVPHHLIDVPWTLISLNLWKSMSCKKKILLNDIHQVTLCFLSANCALDPLIYCFLTKKFKKNFSEKILSIQDSFRCSRRTTESSLSNSGSIKS